MARKIPTVEPESFIAGDTVNWKKTFPDFPADDGWKLTYYFRGPYVHNEVSEADGSDHVITITSAESASFEAGRYTWTAKASKDSEVYTVGTGSMDVTADPSGISTATDERTFARKNLEQVEEALTNWKHGYKAVTYGNTTYTKVNIHELYDIRDKLRIECEAELAAERARKGRRTGRRILQRFTK